jgi:hypothetical protein
MKKALIALIATAPLALIAAWTANAYPISPPSPSWSNLVEQVGCKGGPSGEDRCPYGYRIVGEGRGHCVPCGQQRYGSKYRDWNERYYEPRRYRQYDDERYYEPRRYPREYY